MDGIRGESGATPMEKSTYVREMFATIAPKYDVANRVMTAGIDESWRRRAIRELRVAPGGEVLDLCCGTGDLSFANARSDRARRIVGVDFCEPMLKVARERNAEFADRISFIEGDVMALPFEDARFDGATMGFSMRNVVDIGATLREIRRVLKPGARFVNLDVSKPPNPLWRSLFYFHFYKIVPLLGGLLSGSKSAYAYLPNSLTNFPGADGLAACFVQAGYADVRFVRLLGGIVAIHVGTVPQP
ncbi:bifunctional demethylmenaquinone methyltransferase/2-methoxy-6-polyprenyl-1,4-benzoquinol methylase UbiE [bacterium]|nr:MAG: bifunctional demethylmenaquinone methyltransferase/2-methoxy-6-polyprenyl-1,4-benzoquinol methylase UbiE [bacterium]